MRLKCKYNTLLPTFESVKMALGSFNPQLKENLVLYDLPHLSQLPSQAFKLEEFTKENERMKSDKHDENQTIDNLLDTDQLFEEI